MIALVAVDAWDDGQRGDCQLQLRPKVGLQVIQTLPVQQSCSSASRDPVSVKGQVRHRAQVSSEISDTVKPLLLETLAAANSP